MDLLTLLDMVESSASDRVVIGPRHDGLTAGRLAAAARSAGTSLNAEGTGSLVYMGANSHHLAIALFAAAAAHVPFVPLNYRLGDHQLQEILARQSRPTIVTDDPGRLESLIEGAKILSLGDFDELTRGETPIRPLIATTDPDDVAVLLMTSGTSALPKSAVLRHRHLVSYLFGTSDFDSAEPADAALVSVPPYHIAAIANLLSNLYTGRRICYLPSFSAEAWLYLAHQESVTHAMVVPTMLTRIVKHLKSTGATAPPSLVSLSYGGAKVSPRVVEEALTLFPHTGFMNAYGLTETSSSISVLGPEDHRKAWASDDPVERARLGSVGRPLPNLTIEIRDVSDRPCPPGVVGEIAVKGAQVAGEYLETGTLLDDDGFFRTRDLGSFDEDGYLFVHGRSDDTIIRGGENISPSAIEEVLLAHPAVTECAVAGIPDEEWGQRIAAFIVREPDLTCTSHELTSHVRSRLRGSMTPETIVFLDELPTTATGKVLRRELVRRLLNDVGS